MAGQAVSPAPAPEQTSIRGHAHLLCEYFQSWHGGFDWMVYQPWLIFLFLVAV